MLRRRTAFTSVFTVGSVSEDFGAHSVPRQGPDERCVLGGRNSLRTSGTGMQDEVCGVVLIRKRRPCPDEGLRERKMPIWLSTETGSCGGQWPVKETGVRDSDCCLLTSAGRVDGSKRGKTDGSKLAGLNSLLTGEAHPQQ